MIALLETIWPLDDPQPQGVWVWPDDLSTVDYWAGNQEWGRGAEEKKRWAEGEGTPAALLEQFVDHTNGITVERLPLPCRDGDTAEVLWQRFGAGKGYLRLPRELVTVAAARVYVALGRGL